jgi:cytochrome c oxidase subunit III
MQTALTMKSSEQQSKMDPKKFSLLLLIVGMVMLFMGLTSAVLVRMGEGNWFHFDLPVQFIYSSAVVLVSSLTMWFAYRAAKADEIGKTQILMFVTLIVGSMFVYFQYQGWVDLAQRGIFFVPAEGGANGMISGSFIIGLVGLHLLHLIGGLLFLAVVLIKTLLFQVHKKNLLSINLCNTYWHFVGILWFYLYTFLYFATQL